MILIVWPFFRCVGRIGTFESDPHFADKLDPSCHRLSKKGDFNERGAWNQSVPQFVTKIDAFVKEFGLF